MRARAETRVQQAPAPERAEVAPLKCEPAPPFGKAAPVGEVVGPGHPADRPRLGSLGGEVNQPLLSGIAVSTAVVLLDIGAIRVARALDVEAHGSRGVGRLHGAALIPAETPWVELPELVRRVL